MLHMHPTLRQSTELAGQRGPEPCCCSYHLPLGLSPDPPASALPAQLRALSPLQSKKLKPAYKAFYLREQLVP